MKIVIVEDEIRIRNGLARLLSGYDGVEVAGKAKNGAEGLAMVRQTQPDVVFTDIRMPEMDGLDMLEELKKEGIRCHSVILTGYAEFEYAQRAISCGADAYLLKPVTVEDVEKVLGKLEENIRREAARFEGTPDWYLHACLTGTIGDSPDVMKKAMLAMGLPENGELLLLTGYSGTGTFDEQTLKKHFGSLDDGYRAMALRSSGKKCDLLYLMAGREAGHGAVSGNDGGRKLEERGNRVLATYSAYEDSVWTLQDLWRFPETGPDGIKIRRQLQVIRAAAEKADQMMLWNMVCGKRTVLTEEMCGRAYPGYTGRPGEEKHIGKVLCSGSEEDVKKWIEETYRQIDVNRYDPVSVRRYLSNLADDILHFAIHTWPEKEKQLRELDTAGKIQAVIFPEEMLECLRQQAAVIFTREPQRETIQNYTLMKAIAYIRGHFAEPLLQEEVAASLSVTPEYLSTLMHREMNISFPAFVNQYRISQAKRLLKGTDRKIYEVAEEVGFSDVKYFTRVFREQTGLTPKEFRNQ